MVACAELVVLARNCAEQRRLLPPGEHLLGRSPNCAIVIDCPEASQLHARLRFDGARLRIEDAGSTNGTFVDGARLQSPVELRPGTRVQIGSTVVIWTGTSTGAQTPTQSNSTAGTAESFPAKDLERQQTSPTAPGKSYHAGREIGRGGMGAVLEAEDLRLRRKVAMKVLRPDRLESADAALRFEREAAILAQLEHPNIVPIHELGTDGPSGRFYTMKLVQGTTLQQVVDRLAAGDPDAIARYPLAHLLTIFQKVCDAVAFAHWRGVVHRDLKPDNVMLGEFGEVLVMDWGLAKLVGRPAESEGPEFHDPIELNASAPGAGLQTLDGRIMGTPAYMAPEQAQGRVHDIDSRTDIYALGGILYTLLTLRPPIEASDIVEAIDKIGQRGVLPPGDLNQEGSPALRHCPGRRIPDALSAVAMKALSRDPASRYQAVGELQGEIAAFQGGYATRAETAGPWRLVWLAIQRRRTEWSLAAAALAALLIVSAAFIARNARTLAELRRAAPTFRQEAATLVDEAKFEAALSRANYALSLQPDDSDAWVLKGNVLQSLLRLPEARAAYAQAVRRRPDHPTASECLRVCDEILAALPNPTSLPTSALQKLHDLMRAQGRTVEVLAMARRLGSASSADIEAWTKAWAAAGWKATFNSDTDNRWHLTIAGGPAATNLAPIAVMPPLRALNVLGGGVSDLGPLRGLQVEWLTIEDGRQLADIRPLRGASVLYLQIQKSPLIDLSPLQGMPLRHLSLHDCTNVVDLRRLEGLQLQHLMLYPTAASELSVLRDMPITSLDIVGGPNIRDLSPLRGKAMTYIRIHGCPKVTDLGWATGMPLEQLHANGTGITNLAPLRGMKLSHLDIAYTPVTDLEPLIDMPLNTLSLAGVKANDFAVLRHMPLTNLNLGATPITSLDLVSNLPLQELTIHDTRVRDLAPLAPMPLGILHIGGSAISDLSPLKGLKLTRIDMVNTAVTDLEPLRDAPLELLIAWGSRIRDLSPLIDSRLQHAHFQNTPLTNISGLANKPLTELRLDGCRFLKDLQPLTTCTNLERLSIPFGVRDIGFLRSLPKLTHLTYSVADAWKTTTAEFWTDYDARNR